MSMHERTLVIGNKNLSSWSLRPWLALRHGGIAFREELVRLNEPETKKRLAALSPSARVPVLIDGDLKIWDSLAICEWAAERVPSLWPSDTGQRAVARSVSSEMHSSFQSMRTEMSMNIKLRTKKELEAATRADIARVLAIWTECRSKYGAGGEFLFGSFSIADCMYAPVVTRLYSYGVTLDDVPARYSAAVLAHPAMLAWYEAAAREE